jgi:hypothetical protein
MSNGFENVLKSLGYATGAVTGGPSQVKLVAGTVAVQGKISSYLQQFGQKIGGIVGSSIFENIATGAKVSADEETRSFVDAKVLNGTTRNTILGASIVVLGIFAYFVYKKGGSL